MENAEAYYLYILKSGTADRYHVSISSNPHRRLEYHNRFSAMIGLLIGDKRLLP